MIETVNRKIFEKTAQNVASSPYQRDNFQIISKKSVDSDFANNVIGQFGKLSESFGDGGVNKLVILESADDAKDLADVCPNLSLRLRGPASIAYGIYDRRDKAICIIQNNHKRKDVQYEGDIAAQGSDTLTHEFGHLIDKGYSASKKFRKAYKKDLKKFEKNLRKNPFDNVGNSDMTYEEARFYFKHYMEGAHFFNGINKKDVTRRGLREQWAECFSIAFDSSENEANEIHKELFGNSYKALCDMLA